MIDLVSSLRNFDYGSCLAEGNIWTLDEAVNYLAAYQVNKGGHGSSEDMYHQFADSKSRLANAVKQSIEKGELFVDEKSPGGGKKLLPPENVDLKTTTVQPFVFIDWAVHNNFEVPVEFKNYTDRKKKAKARYYEVLGIKKTTIHHERCRAVAELLWSIEPGMTISEMACRSEIIQYGCDGHVYDIRTMNRWLSSLKADKRLGRPRKK